MFQVSRRDFLGQSAVALGGLALSASLAPGANAARKLKGEMFVIAEIRDEGRPALMIPAASTFLVGAKHYTFVEVGDGQFARIEVSIGKEVNGWVAVTSGIEVGQRVVSSGALQLEQMLENGKSTETPPAKTS